MMANIKLRYNIFLSAILTLLAVSCSNEQEPQIPDPDEGRETSVVDISLTLGDSWDIDVEGTRAAPPTNTTDINKDSYSEIANIDSVKVFTFRRKEGSDGDFYRDKTNEKTILVEKTETVESNHDKSESHTHRIARGTLTKTYGYEYRVIAIAYPPSSSCFLKVEQIIPKNNYSYLSITGNTYSKFCANLIPFGCGNWKDYLTGATSNNTNHINQQVLNTPQIFYGTLHSKNKDSEIIPYADIDKDGNMDTKVGLTGILKRGVAKVTVEFPNITNPYTSFFGSGTNFGDIQWITVLAETPNKKVGLRSYDDFLTPSDSIYIKCESYPKDENKYTAVGYYYEAGLTKAEKSVTFYILPGKTKLAIRVKTVTNDYSKNTYLRNGRLKGNAVEAHGNNGTGIVSPDFDGEVFYFRRNHKYTITINSSPYDIVKNNSMN